MDRSQRAGHVHADTRRKGGAGGSARQCTREPLPEPMNRVGMTGRLQMLREGQCVATSVHRPESSPFFLNRGSLSAAAHELCPSSMVQLRSSLTETTETLPAENPGQPATSSQKGVPRRVKFFITQHTHSFRGSEWLPVTCWTTEGLEAAETLSQAMPPRGTPARDKQHGAPWHGRGHPVTCSLHGRPRAVQRNPRTPVKPLTPGGTG